MVSVLASNVVDRGFEFRSGQIKDYKIGVCSNSAKYKSLMRKRKKYLSSISTLFCQGNKSTKMYITSVIFKLSLVYPSVSHIKTEHVFPEPKISLNKSNFTDNCTCRIKRIFIRIYSSVNFLRSRIRATGGSNKGLYNWYL
jgi:hypothetical protein